MSAARIPYATALAYEDRCEHDAQSSFDDDELRAEAVAELVAARLASVPRWLRDEFAAGRQSAIAADDPRLDGVAEWLREGLLLQTVPSLRELAAILDDDEVAERVDELFYCARG